jgi:hypothetical protein
VTAPAEGNFAFTKDTNSLWYYDGAAWVSSGATGDIEGVTAGVGISGGGTSGTVTVTNSMATAIDAKGDLIAGTGADTFARLAVGGTNGHVLQVDSSTSTGLAWAAPASGGGMTSIASGTFTNTATLDLTSISGSYKNLQFVARNIQPNGDRTLRARLNNLSTSIYNAITITNINGAAATAAYTADDKFVLTAMTGQSPLVGPLLINIFDYANTTSHKNVTVEFSHLNNSGQICQMWLSGTIRTNDAIDRLTLSLSASDFTANGTYTLYGVN